MLHQLSYTPTSGCPSRLRSGDIRFNRATLYWTELRGNEEVSTNERQDTETLFRASLSRRTVFKRLVEGDLRTSSVGRGL